ncbi:hypothetical protein Micbo1qcDRAFT_167009 [Microdochium bolleyi]|uniref:DUF7923 domain-containing protein n=1 Tax=Microdochium bolleyi TaxID=196109 RepID=A0A136IS91_9PEZI|nr:hypothetical protein Micbo1qcDRAFT_167009 [Microdochium bolleyi]
MGDLLVSGHDRFVGIKNGLTSEVANSLALIEELLQDLENTKAALQKTQLDFENESDGRRRFQQQIREHQVLLEARDRRPFIVVLVDADADCYFFKDVFLEKGLKGGELAADALYTALQQFAQTLPGAPSDIDIVVKAFAKMTGLASALHKAGKVRGPEQLRAFAAGFSSRKPFFDFIDVGPLKEGVDVKFKANAEFFLDSFQCKHLVLGCVHDEGYVSWLKQFVGDTRLAGRMTLIEGFPFLQQTKNLNLESIRLDSVFAGAPQLSVNSSFAAAAAGAGAVHGSPVIPVPRVVAGVAQLQVQSKRLGPIVLDADGCRVDRVLQVSKTVAEKIAKGELCYWLYLRGRCEMVNMSSHQRNHVHRALTDEEYDALWEQARAGRCRKDMRAERRSGQGCSDPMCVYGHRK